MKPKKIISDKIECPHCLGTGEIVDANEADEFFKEDCTLCLGEGKIEKTASFKDPFEIDEEEEPFNEFDYE